MVKDIILDCDPGHDDAMALLLAVGNPAINLIGVTTVGGNQSLEKVTYNARSVLDRFCVRRKSRHLSMAKPVWTALSCLSPVVRWSRAMPSTGSSTPS